MPRFFSLDFCVKMKQKNRNALILVCDVIQKKKNTRTTKQLILQERRIYKYK